jgi:hypothetical protein
MSIDDNLSLANNLKKEINRIELYIENLENEYISDNVDTTSEIGGCKNTTIEIIHNHTLHFEVNDYPEIGTQVRDLIKSELEVKKIALEAQLATIINDN